MSSPTKSRKEALTSFGIKPQSLTIDAFDGLIQRLNKILEEVSKVPVSKGPDPFQRSKRKKDILITVSNYLREVKTAQLLMHLSPETTDFDDHDHVASILLYKFTRYERISPSKDPTGRGLIDEIVPKWARLFPRRKPSVFDYVKHQKLKSPIKFDLSTYNSLNIGIMTALELEYQSLIRRLDVIHACSGEYASGLAIRYRTRPTEDLKDLSVRLREMGILGDLEIGWTIGSIGSQNVIVICTGGTGKVHTRDSIDRIEEHLKLQVNTWLDVGICAGSNKKWPIGTVLLSNEEIIDLTRTGSNRFEKVVVIPPLPIPVPEGRKFSAQIAYRRVPQIKKIPVAPLHDIPVFSVKFACVPDVIRKTHDRESIRKFLINQGYLNSKEEFGMEMEGAGTTLFSDSPTMCIIKGVCDYGDDMKESWSPEAKVLFQLYAAETAADYAVSIVRDWKNKVENKMTDPPLWPTG